MGLLSKVRRRVVGVSAEKQTLLRRPVLIRLKVNLNKRAYNIVIVESFWCKPNGLHPSLCQRRYLPATAHSDQRHFPFPYVITSSVHPPDFLQLQIPVRRVPA